LRDLGLLESALAKPRMTLQNRFLYPSLAEKAAVYLFHLVKNHPFLDGNKRTAAVATRVFLRINGISFNPEEQDYEAILIGLARCDVNKIEAGRFVEKWCSSPGPG